ncbi:hypothetical protein [Pseudomonas typographi]|uniref:Uncharacterized protein n=1 Tax=Pseudomonas typographi TaxID=2715964 RepID=A0ABR7Z701_9PSED|nr:hypothetical protein [Pseudomonas typographi]MBD1601162.1 hypothetical protein [Pseudomonas typographi]
MKIQATYETEVYVGGEGHIVIKQQDPCAAYGVDDQVVLLSSGQAKLIAAELIRLAAELEGDN